MAAKELTESQEDYLEAILAIAGKGGAAHVSDVAERLGVAQPSATGAIKMLKRRRLVNYDPYKSVTLTAAGRQQAELVANRHAIIKRFLRDVLGLHNAVAEANACRMEHAVDRNVLQRIRKFTEFAMENPRAKTVLKLFSRPKAN